MDRSSARTWYPRALRESLSIPALAIHESVVVLSECAPMASNASAVKPPFLRRTRKATPNSTVFMGTMAQPPPAAGAGNKVPQSAATRRRRRRRSNHGAAQFLPVTPGTGATIGKEILEPAFAVLCSKKAPCTKPARPPAAMSRTGSTGLRLRSPTRARA